MQEINFRHYFFCCKQNSHVLSSHANEIGSLEDSVYITLTLHELHHGRWLFSGELSYDRFCPDIESCSCYQ